MEDTQTSFLINLKSPILLEAKINQQISVDNDRLVIDASAQLDRLINTGSLGGGKFLAVSGRCSLPVGYLIATRLGHIYGAIAVEDPKLPENGKPRYFVAISHSTDYCVGDIVELDDDKVKIVSYIKDAKKDTDTFFVKLEEDVLQVDFNQLQPAQNDLLVRDACARLAELVSSKVLTGGELLKINGPASLIVSYAIAHKVCHLFKAIAVFDPKMDRYVVTKTDTSNYPLGKTLYFQPDVTYPRMRIVLCGPPNTGKTCLRGGLKKAISFLNKGVYPYFITGAPDGEGSFTAEVNFNDEARGRILKNELKGKFTDDFVNQIARWVRNVNQPLALIDVGGERSPENIKIMASATHAIVLYRDDNPEEEKKLTEWVDFCTSPRLNNGKGLQLIAKLCSDRDAKSDEISCLTPSLEGKIHFIDRTVDVSERETVKALAKLIVEMVQENMKKAEVPS
jgi:CRISPR-associated protein Csx3